jgi:hypothetical protein
MVRTLHLTLLFVSTSQAAFIAPAARGAVGTKLCFGFNGLGSPKPSGDETEEKPDKKIGAAGLLQLITAGMGAPFLGDYQGVDEVRFRVISLNDVMCHACLNVSQIALYCISDFTDFVTHHWIR